MEKELINPGTFGNTRACITLDIMLKTKYPEHFHYVSKHFHSYCRKLNQLTKIEIDTRYTFADLLCKSYLSKIDTSILPSEIKTYFKNILIYKKRLIVKPIMSAGIERNKQRSKQSKIDKALNVLNKLENNEENNNSIEGGV